MFVSIFLSPHVVRRKKVGTRFTLTNKYRFQWYKAATLRPQRPREFAMNLSRFLGL